MDMMGMWGEDPVELVYDPSEPDKLMVDGREYRGSPETGFWMPSVQGGAGGSAWDVGPYVPPVQGEGEK